METRFHGFDVVTDHLNIAGLDIEVLRPHSAMDLIDEDAFEVDERLPYWAELWPSSRVLAEHLATLNLAGRRVLELGCGLGIPSLVARYGGAHVLATDWYPEALEFTRHNSRHAGGAGRLATMVVDWRDPPADLLDAAPFDLIVAADVVYERRNSDALAALIPLLVRSTTPFLMTDPRRPDAVYLVELLGAKGWIHTREDRLCDHPDESGPVIHLHEFRPPA
jgi:predicted nicotinamide N-methyase